MTGSTLQSFDKGCIKDNNKNESLPLRVKTFMNFYNKEPPRPEALSENQPTPRENLAKI